MPASIGDYLANALHLGREEHSAVFLGLIHLLRRRMRDGGVLRAQITGPGPNTRNSSRAVRANFFELHVGQCDQRQAQQERSRFAAKRQSNPNQAKLPFPQVTNGRRLQRACCRCLSAFVWRNRNWTMRPSARCLTMSDRMDNPRQPYEKPSILPAHAKGWTDIAGFASSQRAEASRRAMNSS